MTRKIYSLLELAFYNFAAFCQTKMMVLKLKLKGITYGKRIVFRGKSRFNVFGDSEINIGNNCCFISEDYYNHIGLNHKNIISTHTNEARILIGDNVGMSSTTINCWKSVIIGNGVRIGANAIIMDSDFHIDDPRVSAPKPIVIEDNVWIGANVVVMKGVVIGSNSVIGMNSVVTKSIPSNTIACGNPCKIIKEIKTLY